ncbi:MAG: signal recognition particle protein [bacterium]
MFEGLTDKFVKLQRRLLGHGSLSDKEIADALREIRTLLLDADVNYRVVGHFVRGLKARLEEEAVVKSLRPGEVVTVALYEELTALLGGKPAKLDLPASPSIISLVGLQGVGKTTFAGKLARRLTNRRPLLVACDPKRPAAEQQLRNVAERAGAAFHPSSPDVVGNCLLALRRARDASHGIVLFDTAGRLHLDEELMAELGAIQQRAEPHATLLVLDGLVGQDALNQAEQFSARLRLTGVCITKLDGDSRGGAVVSVRHATGLPIYYIGTGERIDDIEEFRPDRIAARILGKGDLQSLIEKVEAATSPEQQQEIAGKFLKGRFDFEDFLGQLRNIKKMGSLSKLMAMLPGAADMEVDDRELVRVEAMIQSMTPRERSEPDIIDGSRRRRIADGSGTSVQDVNRLLKEFQQTRQLAQQMSGAGPGRLPKGLVPGVGPGFRPGRRRRR